MGTPLYIVPKGGWGFSVFCAKSVNNRIPILVREKHSEFVNRWCTKPFPVTRCHSDHCSSRRASKFETYAERRRSESSVKEVPDFVEPADSLVAQGVVVVAAGSDLIQAAPVLSGKLAHL